MLGNDSTQSHQHNRQLTTIQFHIYDIGCTAFDSSDRYIKIINCASIKKFQWRKKSGTNKQYINACFVIVIVAAYLLQKDLSLHGRKSFKRKRVIVTWVHKAYYHHLHWHLTKCKRRPTAVKYLSSSTITIQLHQCC